jgi:hypothetical protein
MSRHRGFVCATRLYQNLAVALTLSLMVVGAGIFELGLAIRQGYGEPPALDPQHALIRIAAYRTHYPECPPFTQCPPQSVAPPQEHYVVWMIQERATANPRYGRTATRLLVVPLRH